MGNEIIPYSDIEKMAIAVAKSGLFGMKTPEQAIALMLIAQAEGIHPAAAARDYHIIENRPALKADAMLARFLSAGGKVEWHELNDTKVSATFTHNQGGSAKIDWDIARAKRAEVYKEKTSTGKTGMWVKYPRQMLRARVISEGIRTVYPGVSVGIYTPEEVQDFDEKPRYRDITEDAGHDIGMSEQAAEAEVVEIAGRFDSPAPLPEKIKNRGESAIISDAQRKRMFAVAGEHGVHTSEVKLIVERYGFASSKDITIDKYDAICHEIETCKLIQEDRSAA